MIVQLPIGLLGSNCYVVLDAESRETAVIDPGFDDDTMIRDVLQKHGARLCYILNTHGHFDHVVGNALIATSTIALGIHPADRDLLADGGGAAMFGLDAAASPDPDLDLVDGCQLALGASITIDVIHTPGHTPGSVCLYIPQEQSLITGDTLFRSGVGRTDLPGGNPASLRSSLKRLLDLPDATRIFPGHGGSTTLEQERLSNPWLLQLTGGG